MSVKQVAAELRVDESTVNRWIRSGRLKATVIPYLRRNKYQVRQEDLEDFKKGGG